MKGQVESGRDSQAKKEHVAEGRKRTSRPSGSMLTPKVGYTPTKAKKGSSSVTLATTQSEKGAILLGIFVREMTLYFSDLQGLGH